VWMGVGYTVAHKRKGWSRNGVKPSVPA